MRIEYELTEADEIATLRYMSTVGPGIELSKRVFRRSMRRFIVLYAVIFVVCAASWAYIAARGGEPRGLFFTSGFMCVLSGYFLWKAAFLDPETYLSRYRRHVPEYVRTSHGLLGRRTLTVDGASVVIEGEHYTSTMRPGCVERIDATREHVFIMLLNTGALSVPIRSFDGETVRALKHELSRWSGKAIGFIDADV